MNEVIYLGSMFSRDGRYEIDEERRIVAGNSVNGAIAALIAVHNAVLVPTAVIRQRFSCRNRTYNLSR